VFDRQPVLVATAHEHRQSGFRILGSIRRRSSRSAYRGQPFVATEDTEKTGKFATAFHRTESGAPVSRVASITYIRCCSVSDCVVLVRLDAGNSRRRHILRLESAPICLPSASVQEPHGLDDILGRHGHAHVPHVFRRLCVNVPVRIMKQNQRARTIVVTAETSGTFAPNELPSLYILTENVILIGFNYVFTIAIRRPL